MNINGTHYYSIWLHPEDEQVVQIIDQRYLPHKFVIKDLCSVAEVAVAIKEMLVRGAPLIGAAAAYGMYFATLEAEEGEGVVDHLASASQQLLATRPTAINLQWALKRQRQAIAGVESLEEKRATALQTAQAICSEDVEICRQIGLHGLPLIEAISERKKGKTVHILTHCNAGWIATVDWGTATSPIYQAHDKGIDLHVWVDETRPRNQGARLTAWELGEHGVPHTVVVDNVGGHLMQHGFVDMCMVGTDRTTYTGDVANKIGTYLKALAAKDNDVPFYVALPSTTIDWELQDGLAIPIEQRDHREVTHIQGLYNDEVVQVQLTPDRAPAANYAFDVTPARLVTGLITERGVCEASEAGIATLFPKKHLNASDEEDRRNQ